MVTRALTVLESFCCAKTEKNTNSSRCCCSYAFEYFFDNSKVYNLKEDPKFHLYWDRFA